MPISRSALPRWRLAAVALLGAVTMTAAPLHAQFSPTRDLQLRGEWLQASKSLSRDALPSHGASVAIGDGRGNQLVAGWLRAARDLSTVQGALLGYERRLDTGPIGILPGVAIMGGQAKASVDTSGYDFLGSGGAIGRVPRYTFTSGGAAGGAVTLAIEIPVVARAALRLGAQQWFLTGTPIKGDATRFLAGAGLTLCLGRDVGGTGRRCGRGQ